MNDMVWMRWVLQTARRWEDIAGIVQPIGIEVIDTDHRIFTEYVLELNGLIDSLKDKTGSGVQIGLEKDIFRKILDYTQFHFAREEEIMQHMHLPGYVYHRRQHEYVFELVSGLCRDFEAGRVHISEKLKVTLLDWWVRHINVVDVGTFVRKEAFE